MRKLIFSLFVLALLGFAVGAAIAQEEKAATHEYVGDAKCKMCHKDVHKAWSETGHAKAFEVLSAEEKKDAKCVGCHSTGKLADGTLLEGVQCEVCHGPGSDYKSAKIMSKTKWAADPETYKKMAIEAGLVYPDEKLCVNCHKAEGNANFKEFKFAERVGNVHKVVEAEE